MRPADFSRSKMSASPMISKINEAPKDNKIQVAEILLKQYQGEDKAIVEPWLLEMAILES